MLLELYMYIRLHESPENENAKSPPSQGYHVLVSIPLRLNSLFEFFPPFDIHTGPASK